jgi:hypothetical protein
MLDTNTAMQYIINATQYYAGGDDMTEQEKKLLSYFVDALPKLSKAEQVYITGVIDGMVMAKQPSA